MLKKALRFISYPIYLLFFVLIAFEIILRIYNPIPLRLKGEKIVLPTNQSYSFSNEYDCFDKQIVHTKNSLGFRGGELPVDSKDLLKIIAVGGSTTECYFISDDKVWTKVLGDSLKKKGLRSWVNNAGLNGHSTFGHEILLKDIIVPLKPDYVLFLVGINDVDRKDLTQFDKRNLKGEMVEMEDAGFVKNALLSLSNNSEVFNLLFNISKSLKARDQKIFVDKVLTLNPTDTLALSQKSISDSLKVLLPLLPDYRNRLYKIDSTCKASGIMPIFITQPLLYGFGIDDKTGTDLAKAKVYDHMNGELYWKRMELYNQVTRDICKKEQTKLIDLAKLMPKSNDYFYDGMHFTNAGSVKVGEILSKEVYDILKEKSSVK